MDEKQDQDDGEDKLKQVFDKAVKAAIDRHLQRVLDGEEEWEALRVYVDRRLEAALANQDEE